jgi:hypothetical protein
MTCLTDRSNVQCPLAVVLCVVPVSMFVRLSLSEDISHWVIETSTTQSAQQPTDI